MTLLRIICLVRTYVFILAFTLGWDIINMITCFVTFPLVGPICVPLICIYTDLGNIIMGLVKRYFKLWLSWQHLGIKFICISLALL